MRSTVITVVGAVALFALLKMFYLAIRTKWPESYVTASTDVGLVINRSVTRYVLFLVFPTYLTSLLTATTVTRFKGSALACAVIGAAAFLVSGQLRHYWTVVRKSQKPNRLSATLVSLFATISTLAAALLGSFGPGPLSFVVPSIDEFFKSLWTTLFVALLAVFAIHTWGDTTSAYTLALRSKREIGDVLVGHTEAEARRLAVDPALAIGILLTENLQRPAWVRTLERWKGVFLPRGTYGVMQVTSSRSVSDRRSITLAMENHLAGASLKRDEFGIDEDDLRRKLTRYNPSAGFVDVASQMVREADGWSRNAEANYEPEPEAQDDISDASREERLRERVELALRVWNEMAVRTLAKGEGVASIASLPLRDLKALAELADRIPTPRVIVDDDIEHEAKELLRSEDHMEKNRHVANQRAPSEDALPDGS